jgi:dimeric dUTPase (all-alpha-NTP-PPase superfamily)
MDEMGMDGSEELTSLEISYFKASLAGKLEEYDLANKRIGFFWEFQGKVDKKTFFEEERKRLHEHWTPISASLYLSDAEIKEAIGGYDAVIVCWCKFALSREGIIRRMKPRK